MIPSKRPQNSRLLNKLGPTLLLLSILIVSISSCTNAQTNQAKNKQNTKASAPTPPILNPQINSMTDPRDGETYTTVTIGKQTWMAENLRYKAIGSLLHPDHPSSIYGRLYDLLAAETACPDGWHLPSEAAWQQLEMALGYLGAGTFDTGWRGTHGAKMKSTTGWNKEGNGSNSSGFNAFPAGFYFDGAFGGLGESVGFWSAKEAENKVTWVRFLARPFDGVNRFEDAEWALACRCILD